MNIEELMKPYFDKKSAFDKKYIVERNVLNLRLERLRANKEREINEYLQNEVLNRPGVVGYEVVRKDLEQAYAQKEAELENQIKNFDKYYRLDVKEIIEAKNNLRSVLFKAEKEIQLELEETKLKQQTIKLELARFKHEYDDQGNVLTGNKLRELFDRSNSFVEQIYNLENQLKKIGEYKSLIELTPEEAKIGMMTLTPWEQEEYDRRNAVKAPAMVEPVIEEPITEEPVVDEPTTQEPSEEIVEQGEEIVENQVVVENVQELIEMVFTDVLESAKKLRTIKLSENEGMHFLGTKNHGEEGYTLAGSMESEEDLELPNGIYLNRRDINKALDNYVRQNKGRTFKVKGVNKVLEVNRKNLRELKRILRDCSTIKLLREKKISSFDIKRVFGKEKSEKYVEMTNEGIKTKLPSGEYVNVNEMMKSLGHLFSEKSPSWIERFRQKLADRRAKKETEELDYVEEETSQKTR